MPPLTPGTMAQHMQPAFRAILGTSLQGREVHYSRTVNVETSTRNYEDYFAAVGLPAAADKPVASPIVAFDPVEGSSKRVTHNVTAIGVEVAEETWSDDQYQGSGSAIRSAPANMADSLAERVELDVARLFSAESFGATPTFTSLPDGLAIFHTAHTPIPGGAGTTQANTPSTNTDFNVTSFRLALTAGKRYKNDQGVRIPGQTQFTELMVPPELEYAAMEVVNSSNRPDTMNRVENVTRGVVGVHVNPYIDDTDAWFLRAKKHHAYLLWRWRPQLDSFDDRRSRVAIHVAYQRYSYFVVGWLGLYGSQG